MGIQIKKVLGYGLQMTAEEGSELIDSPVVARLDTLTGQNYIDFLTAKYANAGTNEISYQNNDLHISDVSSILTYSAADFVTVVDTAEEDRSQDLVWVVITPPLVCTEWKHIGDPIDYYENAYRLNSSENELNAEAKFLKQGLFPYYGPYINHLTGELLADKDVSMVRLYHQRMQDGAVSDDEVLRSLLKPLNVSSLEEFELLVHPAPPTSVVDIAEWTGIFKKPSIATILRPCLLTYWS